MERRRRSRTKCWRSLRAMGQKIPPGGETAKKEGEESFSFLSSSRIPISTPAAPHNSDAEKEFASSMLKAIEGRGGENDGKRGW